SSARSASITHSPPVLFAITPLPSPIASRFHHHVPRDVHADLSGGRVTGERSLVAALGFDVAGAVRRVAKVDAAARALDAGERFGMIGREAIEGRHVPTGREDRELPPTDGLDLVADLVDRHRARALSEPPGPNGQRRADQQEAHDEETTAHALRPSGMRRFPRRRVPRPVASSYSASVNSWNVAARLKRASNAPVTTQYG